MKKLVYLLFLICTLCVSCSQSQKVSKEATKAMELTIRDLAKNPENVKITNINTVYANDSLCILHFDFTGKNGLGNETTDKMEYLYIVNEGKKYEAFHELGSDSVFIDQSTWEKTKKGTIYEKLGYDDAIRYLAATFTNSQGRAVGDKSQEEEVNIKVPTQTGKWELKYYSDDFGEKTDAKYLVLMGKGVFSNSATINSRLTVVLFVDGDSYSIRLFEYDSSPVKDDNASYVTRIKDSEGTVHEMSLTNSGQSGQIRPYSWENNYDEFVNILKKGGEITVTMSYRNYGQSDYRFKLNVEGFNEAIKYVE